MVAEKTILLTGATDGIGLVTARLLADGGHALLLHGRNEEKLESLRSALSALPGAGRVEVYRADLSKLSEVSAMASGIVERHESLDVLINNAGVFKTPAVETADGLDVRFVVNTLAPYLLTQRLLPLLGTKARIVNLSSAAQAPVELDALGGAPRLRDFEAYAQSKLAITMWSRHLARVLGESGPVVVAVNPASMLGSKMVKEGFGVDGKDIAIGARVLVRAALSDEFADASGKYFDNDSEQFAVPHEDALDDGKCEVLVRTIEATLVSLHEAQS